MFVLGTILMMLNPLAAGWYFFLTVATTDSSVPASGGALTERSHANNNTTRPTTLAPTTDHTIQVDVASRLSSGFFTFRMFCLMTTESGSSSNARSGERRASR